MPRQRRPRLITDPVHRGRAIAAQLRRLSSDQRAMFTRVWADVDALHHTLTAALAEADAAFGERAEADSALAASQGDNRQRVAAFVAWSSDLRRDLAWAAAQPGVPAGLVVALRTAASALDRRTRSHIGLLREAGAVAIALEAVAAPPAPVAAWRDAAITLRDAAAAGEAAAHAGTYRSLAATARWEAALAALMQEVRLVENRWEAARDGAPVAVPPLVFDEDVPPVGTRLPWRRARRDGTASAEGGQEGADAGQRGADAGQRGADAGQGGADAGQGGADAGQGGADAGQRGADGSSGGSGAASGGC